MNSTYLKVIKGTWHAIIIYKHDPSLVKAYHLFYDNCDYRLGTNLPIISFVI